MPAGGGTDVVHGYIFVITGAVILVGAFSRLLGRSPLTGPGIMVVLGILLGPYVADVFHLRESPSTYQVLEELARLTLAMGVMGIAIYLPALDVAERWKTLATLLGLVMPAMWLISGALIYAITGLPFAVALLIGAVLSPTDPILARAIAQGRLAQDNVPRRLRNAILAESGANDGLAYPFVLLMAYLVTKPLRQAIQGWVVHAVLWGVVVAVFTGAFIGIVFGLLMRWAKARDLVAPRFLLSFSVALALFVVAAVELMHSDGVLATFVAGIALIAVRGRFEDVEEEEIQEAINILFAAPAFFLIGVFLPWGDWVKLGWAAFVIPVAILLARRLPAVLALRRWMSRDVRDYTEATFLGWFGPIGVSALFYAMLALRQTGRREVWVVASLVIFASTMIHGATGTYLSRKLGEYERARGREIEPGE